jgi:hypothetical protein
MMQMAAKPKVTQTSTKSVSQEVSYAPSSIRATSVSCHARPGLSSWLPFRRPRPRQVGGGGGG